MNGGMSGNDLMNIVLASGTGRVNREFYSMKSSLFNYFMQDENIDKENGHGKDYNMLVEGENVRPYKSGSIWPTNKTEILNQYHIPYKDIFAGVNFDGTEISKQLGGYSIEDFMGGDAPKRDFPVLINEMEEHLWNVKRSFVTNQSAAHYTKQVAADGAENVDGFDIMFAPDTEYGGKSYRALGEHEWNSLLMGGTIYRHNPLHKDFGGSGFPTIFGDIANVCIDISRGRADMAESSDPAKIKIMAMCGPGAFSKLDAMFNRQITREGNQQHSSTIGIQKPIMWDRYGLEIHCDHYCPEDTMYFWAKEVIKKVCQKGPRGEFSLRRVRLAFAQDEILVPWTVEYNLGCSARWQICSFTNMGTGPAVFANFGDGTPTV